MIRAYCDIARVANTICECFELCKVIHQDGICFQSDCAAVTSRVRTDVGADASEGGEIASTRKSVLYGHSPENFYTVGLDVYAPVCDAGSRVACHIRLNNPKVLNDCIPADL